ncbi:dipeptidase PepE [Flavicella sp.]|uniref:dipeptidase PepE n=1 Tax=Flavicella sp. TaxID=2957742 RepID=UPI00301938C8
MRNVILASSSTSHGSRYLEYLQPELKKLFNAVSSILFIPYARPGGISYDDYTEIAKKGFEFLGIEVKGVHSFENPKNEIEHAEAIFVGGGNTFVLVASLYEKGLMDTLSTAIEKGTPYLGTSAGSNICGVNMQTTNDMPIIMPESFKTLEIIPFNINAHFITEGKNSTHKGETRETRIKEFHVFNEIPVIGLPEGSWLNVIDNEIILGGNLDAILFQKGKQAVICEPGMSF